MTAKIFLILSLIFLLIRPKFVAGQGSLSAYPPLPTGSGNKCTLSFQNPNHQYSCVNCLIKNRPDLRQLYTFYNHNMCTDQQIINNWCNGQLGSQAIADCNAIKNGLCNLPPDRPCATPTPLPGRPTATPTPPATVNTSSNPRGCGILYTAGVPSCWCNNGGGQGLCGNIPLDGLNGCRSLCERGLFVGPSGRTHCFIAKDGQECYSNDDGTYRYCFTRCLPGNVGYSQTVGCEYPNKTLFSDTKLDPTCLAAYGQSSNDSFFQKFQQWLSGILRVTDIQNFVLNAVRVPGLQKAECDPRKEKCTFN